MFQTARRLAAVIPRSDQVLARRPVEMQLVVRNYLCRSTALANERDPQAHPAARGLWSVIMASHGVRSLGTGERVTHPQHDGLTQPSRIDGDCGELARLRGETQSGVLILNVQSQWDNGRVGGVRVNRVRPGNGAARDG